MCEGMRRCDRTAPRGRGLPRALDGGRAGRVPGLALALVLAACGGQGQGQRPPPTVGVVVVEPQAVTLTTELPGRTSPYETADVRPQVGGIIEARLFNEGQVVSAGQTLYQIEPAPFQAAYAQAEAQLANAEANLTAARLRAERDAQLVKLNSIALQDADDAEAAFRQAEATVRQEQAAVTAARINLDFTRVKAPIGGRIGISKVTKGALVTTNQAS